LQGIELSDIIIEPEYKETTRYYTIRFFNKEESDEPFYTV
jgi:hypothetical protein